MTASDPTRRTWPQRITIGAAIVGAVACFTSAAALATGRWVLSQRQLVVIDDPASTTVQADGAAPQLVIDDLGDPLADSPEIEVIYGDVEPGASNFLLVGTDNNACIDPNSPYAPFILGRENFGERADVIQMWRVNSDTGAVAALSFPRDLYVRIDGGRQGRINTAFDPTDPNRLISTIRSNFGIDTDHYVQVDFCAFKTMVDSVDGVGVPLTYPIRDRGTGLEMIATGCVTLNGDDALAYVRSRKLEYERPEGSGTWVLDPSSDWGRIARQQDFLRRTIAKVISAGLYQPSVARALIEANADDVVTDSGLSLSAMLSFAGVLRSVNTDAIGSYQVEATGRTVSGQAVLIPTLSSESMQAILDIFQGDSTIEGTPVRLSDLEATTTVPAPNTTSDTTTDTVPSTTEATETAETTVEQGPAGEVAPSFAWLPRQDPPDDNTIGWVPDPSITCG